MKWLQHSIVQLDQRGIACQFSTDGAAVQGWVMPDGIGVTEDAGEMVEFNPETITTDHPEALHRSRRGAADRHAKLHVQDYCFVQENEWVQENDLWVKLCRVTLAGIPGALSMHVTFKPGSAESVRYYTEFHSDQQARAEVSGVTRQGRVGDLLHSGEVVLTSSGRLTSPFPKIDLETERKAGNTIKRVQQWLVQNALDEALAREDDFNALLFKASLNQPQQADKDSAELYLFGTQPAVVPSPLRHLAKTSPQAPAQF